MASTDDNDFEQFIPKPKRAGPSLKARAVAILSRREHSRVELARKLAPHADPEDAAQLQTLLDELERDNWLSNERFAQSLVNRRAGGRGAALVLQELRQHGLADEQLADIRQQLQSTELQRATDAWYKKFGRAPVDAKDHARQLRFLASRGFSGQCLRHILADFNKQAGNDSYGDGDHGIYGDT